MKKFLEERIKNTVMSESEIYALRIGTFDPYILIQNQTISRRMLAKLHKFETDNKIKLYSDVDMARLQPHLRLATTPEWVMGLTPVNKRTIILEGRDATNVLVIHSLSRYAIRVQVKSVVHSDIDADVVLDSFHLKKILRTCDSGNCALTNLSVLSLVDLAGDTKTKYSKRITLYRTVHGYDDIDKDDSVNMIFQPAVSKSVNIHKQPNIFEINLNSIVRVNGENVVRTFNYDTYTDITYVSILKKIFGAV